MAFAFSLDLQFVSRPHFSFRSSAPSPSLLPLRRRRDLFGLDSGRPSPDYLRGSLYVRAGLSPHLPDFEATEGLARELFGRVEGLLYTIADAAVSSSDVVEKSSKQSDDWLTGITNYLETVLKVLKDGLSSLHVPYSYGFAIILLTILVKAATFPLTKKQVESALAMRALQPQIKAIQQRYTGDQERIQLETARLYKLAGINPLAGCLPTLLTIPVWIGLYRALSNVANEGLLTEGFFWIPSLSGPTTIAARQSGSGISWLFPFVDGHPPLGWSDTFAYLVLPVLLVISQYISSQIMQSSQVNDPSQQNAQAVTKFLPLLIGYFALSVPSGLSLYWLTNNILSTAQQIWLQKLGGAKNPVQDYINITTRDDSSTRQKTISTAQKTVSDVGADFSNPSQGQQNEITGGLRPGERFKQIKEEEARRRKQREEAKKRALEATEHSDIAIKQISLEATSIETSDEPIENADIQVLKKEKEVHLSVTENGGLNSKTRMSNEDNIGTGNVIKEETASLTSERTSQSPLDERERD
ncbi:ALBINO3-like protein 1, chloroplastic [Zingiber officinale]|uniref:ALBINO3-like protein 1, chloroplastic n=1 Tax=Zingiber officinale TaxID=94328 RepID=UPI001C4B4DF5|nr:ALBINO3-like protein 1, chloroplastic [Zingiber officinale]XP_042378219.1 ALBINO3-like protein 1, chloroplastic [Zingiber officinale]XP_042378220.1 ALBINO3-like protein 1, chloroplastic [Zingiber officinale]XP_042378221.1 ALBINO3-like protein 1, chloroplastic [Zingiber officinale]XP_042378222.1 ALBINO3-like protein 1, chloroplastic [Zingiber officinale]